MALLDLNLLENSSHTINSSNADETNNVKINALGSSELIVDGVAADVNSIVGVEVGAKPTFAATNGGEMNIDQGLLNVGVLNDTTFRVDGDSAINMSASEVSALDGLNAMNVEFAGEQPGSFTYDKSSLGVLSTVDFNVNGAKAGDQFDLAGGDTLELDKGALNSQDAFRDGALNLKGGGAGLLQTRVNAKINMTEDEYTDWVDGRSDSEINDDLASNGFTFPGDPVCFAAGTMIATPDGETAVETLAIGDSILTASGDTVAVKWIGRQSLRPVAANEKFQAVRVAQGALGNGLPHQDLTLTAGHGLIIDDVVINAGVLVNGSTIDYVSAHELPSMVTYYHVETDNHEVILANGTEAETYVDYVDRKAFDNYAEYVELYGHETRIVEMPRHRISSRRLLPLAVRQRLGIEDAMTRLMTA